MFMPKGDAMEHIVSRNWNRPNRSERIKSIVAALNRPGAAEAEYFRGRSYLTWLLLGKGHPTPVNEDNEWNQVTISCQGKDAIEIFDQKGGPDGRFFDENFTEDEKRRIINALAEIDIFTWQDYISRRRWTRPLLVTLVLVGSLGVVRGFMSGDPISMNLFLCIALGYSWFLLRR